MCAEAWQRHVAHPIAAADSAMGPGSFCETGVGGELGARHRPRRPALTAGQPRRSMETADSATGGHAMDGEGAKRLLILWTSAERETALHMVLMYATNARKKRWWPEVVLLIWGASARLAAQDTDVQVQLRQAHDAGVRVLACRRCAERLGVVEGLERLGVEVFYTGEFLTEWLRSGDAMLTV